MRLGIWSATVAAGTLLLAGCSSGPSTPAASGSGPTGTGARSATGAGGASGTAGATGAGTGQDAALKTGAQLKAALPVVADLPKAKRFRIPTGGEQDTGNLLNPAFTPATGKRPNCQQLESNAWVVALGQPAAFAQTVLSDAAGDQVFPEIDAYHGTTARTVMAGYRKLFAACRTFTMTESGRRAKVTVTLKTGPKVGDESIRALMISPTFQGGTTVVVIRKGPYVITVYYNSPGNDLGARAVTLATKMAGKL